MQLSEMKFKNRVIMNAIFKYELKCLAILIIALSSVDFYFVIFSYCWLRTHPNNKYFTIMSLLSSKTALRGVVLISVELDASLIYMHL